MGSGGFSSDSRGARSNQCELVKRPSMFVVTLLAALTLIDSF